MPESHSFTQSPSTRAGLVSELSKQIAVGALPYGSQLPSERALAAKYGLSRSAVREALRTLIDQRVLTVQPGRGTFIHAPHPIDTAETLNHLVRRQQPTPRNLIEARRAIESEAASLAALRADAADLNHIGEMLKRCATSSSLVDQVRSDLAFHLGIVRSADSPVLETLFTSIAGLVVEMMLRSLTDAKLLRVGLPIHEEIFAAISSKNASAARDGMERHLLVAESAYGSDFDRPLDVLADRALRSFAGSDISVRDLLTLADVNSQR